MQRTTTLHHAQDERVKDAGNYFTGTDVETSLQELGANVREKLSAARTYYVRTDGSDSNDGLTNSSGGAFATIQKAYDTIQALDTNGKTTTIKFGNAGTYTGGLSITSPWVGGGQIVIEGDTATPSNILWNVTGNCITTSGVLPAKLAVKGVKFQSSSVAINHSAIGTIDLQGNIEFGACTTAHMATDQAGANIIITGNYTINGNSTRHLSAIRNSVISYSGTITVTLSGTPAFSTAFAIAHTCASMYIINSSVTFSGSATGTRYNISANGVIQTFGGGATYLPGDVAGTTATGGQYA